MKKTYICIVESNSSYPREYPVTTSSAYKAAGLYGRCEGGETVTIVNKSGRVISRVQYTPQDGGEYIRVCVDPNERIALPEA